MTASSDPPAPASAAERARRNGARSRGPVSAEGKARASRNALRHGCAPRLHVVVEPEDDAAFAELSGRLFAELAPEGELEGFLVARLAAVMWKTGRAERLETQALTALAGPDPGRLGLALRYQGSVAREFRHSLRELRRLRAAPLAETPTQAGITADPPSPADPLSPADAPDQAADPEGLPPAALAAWGGLRPPPGCLLLRPVPHFPAWRWHRYQHFAHPAATPVLIDRLGNLVQPVGNPVPPPAPAPPTGGLRHGLTLADLGPAIESGPDPDPELAAAPGEPGPETVEPPDEPGGGGSAAASDAKLPNEPRSPDGIGPPETGSVEDAAPTGGGRARRRARPPPRRLRCWKARESPR